MFWRRSVVGARRMWVVLINGVWVGLLTSEKLLVSMVGLYARFLCCRQDATFWCFVPYVSRGGEEATWTQPGVQANNSSGQHPRLLDCCCSYSNDNNNNNNNRATTAVRRTDGKLIGVAQGNARHHWCSLGSNWEVRPLIRTRISEGLVRLGA